MTADGDRVGQQGLLRWLRRRLRLLVYDALFLFRGYRARHMRDMECDVCGHRKLNPSPHRCRYSYEASCAKMRYIGGRMPEKSQCCTGWYRPKRQEDQPS